MVKTLSTTQILGQRNSRNRIFFFYPRKNFTPLTEEWLERVYEGIRSELISLAGKSSEPPLNELLGIHLKVFHTNELEESTFKNLFGIEYFVSSEEFHPNWYYDFGPHRNIELGSALASQEYQQVLKIEKLLGILRAEIVSARNKTPLLLPFKNFNFDEMSTLRQEVQSVLDSDGLDIKSIISKFNKRNPKKKPDTAGKKKSFEVYNNKQLYFTPPGKNLHAAAVHELKEDSKHLLSCWVRGVLRFGIPFEPKFHYDCTRKIKKLTLENCHGEICSLSKARTHINIAPNDFLR